MPNSSSDSTPVRGTPPSRRQFFHKAGLTAGVGHWLAGAEAATNKRSYVAGRFGLELDGVFRGFLSSFEGGNITADVVTEATGTDRIQRIQLSNPKIEPDTSNKEIDHRTFSNTLSPGRSAIRRSSERSPVRTTGRQEVGPSAHRLKASTSVRKSSSSCPCGA